MIFTVGGIKGGTGKTTVATNLVVWLIKQNFDVLLVDADEQETATDFGIYREETLGKTGYTQIKLSGETVRKEILKLQPKFDHIVIDTGGRDTNSQRAALFSSDVFIIPFTPRSFDIWTLEPVAKMLNEIRTVKPTPLLAVTFINGADTRGSDNADAAASLQDIKGIEYIDCPLVKRKAFSNASGRGLSVLDLTLADPKAVFELNNLFESIFKLCQSVKNPAAKKLIPIPHLKPKSQKL